VSVMRYKHTTYIALVIPFLMLSVLVHAQGAIRLDSRYSTINVCLPYPSALFEKIFFQGGIFYHHKEECE
jgi:hypothetical protein